MPGRAWRRPLLGLLALALAASAAAGWQWWQRQGMHSRGDALFHGRAPLAGHLPGHEMALPVRATRCSNCHDTQNAVTAVNRAVEAPQAFGSTLDAAHLGVPRSRRGGPPTRFDPASLCTLLRTGVDPAQIVLPATMPRYAVTDTQCSELWTYLASR